MKYASWFWLYALVGTVHGQDPYGNVSNPVSVYEVTLPLPDLGSPCASQILVNQEFANSYGKPVFVEYTPPKDCPNFTHVTADIYLASYGYQYDRLMHVLKDGTEVWRPSTAEPVGHNITCHESKDLSTFTDLFKTAGVVEFSLDNTLESGNSGPFYTELRLNYYTDTTAPVSDTNWFYDEAAPPSNFYAVIANDTFIDQQPATGKAPQLPRNTTRAVLSVFASGNSNEEFWYSNVFSQDSPTRLIQVSIDGKIAGLADPFPVVYTGGLNPGLWQPLMGLKASDVPSYLIDVSPFLPWLWDHEANFQIAIGDGYNDTQGILSNWIVSASLLTWASEGLEGSGHIITTSANGGGYPIQNNNTNSSSQGIGAFYSHSVSNTAALTFVNGNNSSFSGQASWSQSAEMSNHLNESDTLLFVQQYGKGSSQSTWKPDNNTSSISYERSHYYPLSVNLIQTGSSYKLVSVNRSYDVNISSNGKPYWERIDQEAVDDENHYTSITDVYAQNYNRHAEAVNGSVVEDTGA